jgi:uncharacterized membrane protein YkoI
MSKALILTLAGTLFLGGSANAFADIGSKEQKMTMAELPPAVQETIKKQANGAKIEKIEKETAKDGTVIYEAEIKRKGRNIEIKVAPDGTLLDRGKEF